MNFKKLRQDLSEIFRTLFGVLALILVLMWGFSFFGIIGIIAIFMDGTIPNIFAYLIIIFNIWAFLGRYAKIKSPLDYLIPG